MSIEVQILDSYYLPRFGVEDEQQRVYLGKLLDNIHVVLEEILATTPAPDSAKYLLYDTPPATLPNAAKLVGSSSITMTPSSGLETLSVAASGVTANTYGDATHIPQFTVLADGRVTGVTNVGISSGTVTSVGLTTPAEFSVAGSPVTGSGTLAVTKAVQNANIVYAGPTTGAAAQPTFRSLVAADIPSLPYGTGTVTSVSVVTNNGISGSVATTTTTPAITINGAQAAFYGVASGTNTYIVALSPVSTSYVTGVTYTVTFTNANTSTATLNANSLGAKAIQLAGSALTSGQIPANATLDLVYDGTQFQIIGTSGSGTVTTTGSPANGNLTKFSGSTSITNGDLSGDVTTSGTLATTIANNAVTTAKINNNAVTLSKLATQADQTALVNISGGAAVPTASTFDAANIQRTYYAASTSGTTTYTATLAPVPTAYVTGAQYVFTVSNTNTGAVTMNFNSLGAKTLQLNGVALTAGQLQAGATYQSIYDGTNLQVTASSFVAGGGGRQKIAQVVTSGSASVITFSSIPGTYTDLVLTFHGRSTGATADVEVHLKINNDTASGNYSTAQFFVGSGTSSVANGKVANANGGYSFGISGTTGQANPLSIATLTIPDYARTTFNKAEMSHFYDTSASTFGGFAAFQWLSTAIITRLDLTIASGSFLDGTICTLYGDG